jgi:tRNA G10  N-methylase Trm11
MNEYGLKDAKFTVSTGDSRHLTETVGRETVDCIVTEPDLGPPLRHLPTEAYAERITSRLKPLYASFLQGAYEALRPGGNLVFVTPHVKTRSGNFITLNLEEEVNTIGFRKTHPFENGTLTDGSSPFEELATASSFVDIAKRHKIGRRINILQKQ